MSRLTEAVLCADVIAPTIEQDDFTFYVGDALDVLAQLPAESVDCCVTSPPYWGLRDYGTGQWDGGDPDCDHAGPPKASDKSGLKNDGRPPERVGQNDYERAATVPFRDVCGKCGATRVDRQIGLEPTPEAYVEQIVAVFREVRRVLAPHGTLWLNLGDSYAANRPYQVTDNKHIDVGNTKSSSVPAGLKPKDLVGIPWRVAFALQADGWYLRADIIWSKPNPMPESVTDRPTKAHEYVFLLSKNPRYFFDQEAVREAHQIDGRKVTVHAGQAEGRTHDNHLSITGRERWPNGGRNIRSVWEIATQPYPDAHFATFPEVLAERCIKAGCPERVCVTCGKPSERIVDVSYEKDGSGTTGKTRNLAEPDGRTSGTGWTGKPKNVETTGYTDCGHGNYRTGVVFDPFMGSGTVALVARKHGRHAIGIELNPEYAKLADKRNAQQTIFG